MQTDETILRALVPLAKKMLNKQRAANQSVDLHAAAEQTVTTLARIIALDDRGDALRRQLVPMLEQLESRRLARSA